jgi:hypothetical protein
MDSVLLIGWISGKGRIRPEEKTREGGNGHAPEGPEKQKPTPEILTLAAPPGNFSVRTAWGFAQAVIFLDFRIERPSTIGFRQAPPALERFFVFFSPGNALSQE